LGLSRTVSIEDIDTAARVGRAVRPVERGADGQIVEAHSISAGLDYPGVGPEHAWLKDSGRATYVSVTDDQAMEGFDMLARLEGIQPALESSHAIAYACRLARRMRRSETVLVNLSGRGDKDMGILMGHMERKS